MNPSRKFRTWKRCPICPAHNDGLHSEYCDIGKLEDEIDRLAHDLGKAAANHSADLNAGPYVWQPISTAPRDGTVILLRRSDDDLFGYTSATRPMKRHAVGYYKDFWISGAPGGHSQGGGDNQFTHWAPLPIGGISPK